MSRASSIGYRIDGKSVSIPEVGNEDLMGTQRISMAFWSMPQLKQLGLNRLIELGYTDPVCFVGWDDIAELDKEISILEKNFHLIQFHESLKLQWFANLRFNLDRLRELCPKDAEPEFSIG